MASRLDPLMGGRRPLIGAGDEPARARARSLGLRDGGSPRSEKAMGGLLEAVIERGHALGALAVAFCPLIGSTARMRMYPLLQAQISNSGLGVGEGDQLVGARRAGGRSARAVERVGDGAHVRLQACEQLAHAGGEACAGARD